VSAIEAVVARFARAKRHDLWPRFAARAAGVTTAQARDAMIELAEDGLLDLWYVVMCENGDEVRRLKHPEPAPIGQRVTCYRCDEPNHFDVTDEDVYLMFSPTDRLRTLAGQVTEDDPSPKGQGADSTASAPFLVDPEELARRAEAWNDEKRVLELHIHAHYGDTIGGDLVSGDKVGRDKTGGDKVGGSKIVGGDSVTGDKTTTAATGTKKKTGSAIVITLGIIVAIASAIAFYLLGHHQTLRTGVAVSLAAICVAASLGISNAIASHLRG
jgi:hypothetical protein